MQDIQPVPLASEVINAQIPLASDALRQLLEKVESVEQQSRGKTLLKLNFYRSCIGYLNPSGCQLLACTSWNCLIFLDLEWNQIGSKGTKYLARAHWLNLVHLNLATNLLDDSALYIARMPTPSLQELVLHDNVIGPKGCRHFCKWQLSKMQKISVWYNAVLWKGCEFLAKGDWEELKLLQIGQNAIRKQGRKWISHKFKAQVNCEKEYEEQ